jgi:nucleoside-triphosphatase
MNVLITGRPGVGKTTLVQRVVSRLGVRPRGFTTEEIRVGGVRKGFRIRIFGGKEGVLAHVGLASPYRVGRYGVDLRAFEEIALPELEEALEEGAFLVIDEIGTMELFSRRFRDLVLRALDTPAPLLGVLKERGDGFLRSIREREDVRLFTLTTENREEVEEAVLGEVGGEWHADMRC